MSLTNFNVLEPPTGGEVEAEALRVLGENALLRVVLLATDQEVPKPTNQEVTFRIRQTGHPKDGGMVITGFTEPGGRHIIIQTAVESSEIAQATIVGT